MEAAIARTRKLDDLLHGLAAERFSSARPEASAEHGGFFAGQPTFVKDNSDVAGLPDPARHPRLRGPSRQA